MPCSTRCTRRMVDRRYLRSGCGEPEVAQAQRREARRSAAARRPRQSHGGLISACGRPGTKAGSAPGRLAIWWPRPTTCFGSPGPPWRPAHEAGGAPLCGRQDDLADRLRERLQDRRRVVPGDQTDPFSGLLDLLCQSAIVRWRRDRPIQIRPAPRRQPGAGLSRDCPPITNLICRWIAGSCFEPSTWMSSRKW
jgi:hypothetical protein